MQRNKLVWTDGWVILGLFLVVLFFCFPWGRNWNVQEQEMYTGREGGYSPDADSYYYLRRAREFTENGFSSIRLIYSRTEDPFITAVQSSEDDVMPQLLSAIVAILWYALHALGINIGIYKLAICFCASILAFFVVPIYIFLRKRLSRLAAAFGAITVPLMPPFFRHSCYGFFDTDALIGFLAITMVLSLYECILSKKTKDQIVYGSISLGTMVLLFFTWTAFFVYSIIAVGTAFVGLLAKRLYGGGDEKGSQKLWVPIAFMVSILAGGVFLGGGTFLSLAEGFLKSGKGVQESWPSVTRFISELKRPRFSDASSFWYLFVALGSDYRSYFGGAVFLFLLLGSIILSINRVRLIIEEKEPGEELFLQGSILTWFLGTVVMCFFGIRYMEFVIIPSGIIMAYGFSRVERFLSERVVEHCDKRLFFLGIGTIIYCCFVLALQWKAVIIAGMVFLVGFFAVKIKWKHALPIILLAMLLSVEAESCWLIMWNQTPLITDTVVNAMQWVQDNTPKDAVLADFWSLGYIYQYYGRRRTVADGGTYNGEYFYWLGTMITTDDLKLAAGIARMLQCGGIDGSEFACELCGTKMEACQLIKDIIVLSRQEAYEYLVKRGDIGTEQAAQLLGYTHPEENPEVYFVANYDTFKGVSSLTYYRDWAFSEELSSEPQTMMPGVECVKKPKEGEKTTCYIRNSDESLQWNVVLWTENEEVNGNLQLPNVGEVECERKVYYRDGKKVYDRRVIDPGNSRAMLEGEALMIFEEEGQISWLVCEASLPDSIFVRLYLLEGGDQNVFEKVYETKTEGAGLSGETKIQRKIGANAFDGEISIWRINYE